MFSDPLAPGFANSFEPPDPLESIYQQVPGLRPTHTLAPQNVPLTPEEEQSMKDRFLNAGVGGLQYLGDTIGKPGRIVRGLLGGDLREGLGNLIPFSDFMGITDPSKQVSGRQLLENIGVLDQNQTGLDAGDVAGLGAEVALDPLTYATFGLSALGKAGKVAKLAGVLPKTRLARMTTTLDDILTKATPEVADAIKAAAAAQKVDLATAGAERLGGLFGGHVPFSGGASHIPEIAQGPAAQVLAGGMDKLGSAISKSAPARALSGLFDYTTKGFSGEYTQPLGRAQTAATEALMPSAKHDWAAIVQPMQDIRDAFQSSYGKQLSGGELDEVTQRLVRAVSEGVKPDEAMALINQHHLPGQSLNGNITLTPEIRAALPAQGSDFLKTWKEATSKKFDTALDMGLASAHLPEGDLTAHTARYRNKGDVLTNGWPTKEFSTTFGSAKNRLEPTKLLATDAIDAIYKDGDVARAAQEVVDQAKAVKAGKTSALLSNPMDDLRNTLEKKYGNFIYSASDTLANTAGPYVGMTKQGAYDEVLRGLADHLITDNKALQTTAKYGKDKYGTHWLKAQLKYMTDLTSAQGNMEAIHHTLADNLVAPGAGGSVPLKDVFEAAGMNPDRAMNWFAKQNGPQAAAMSVPRDIADAIKTVTFRKSDSDTVHFIKTSVDLVTNLLKKHLTLPFPSFWTRNAMGGQGMNFLFGDIPNPAKAKEYFSEVRAMGKVAGDPSKHADKVREWLTHGVISPEFAARDVDALSNLNLAPIQGNLLNPLDWWKSLKESGAATADISRAQNIGNMIPGVSGKVVGSGLGAIRGATNAPAQFGARVSSMVEFMNRVPMYEYLKKQGYTATQAAERVKLLQVDYSRFTPFEKDVMKRLVPFYAYTRKTVPAMLSQLMQRPGGALAQTIRASNTGRGQGEFVPPYVGEGMSVALGPDTFLSQLGLPTDQFSDLMATGPTLAGSVKRTGQKLMSMMNPLVKAPIELGTGINLFAGRPHEQLHAFPTDSVLVNSIMHETPASRYLTTGRQLIDERKPWWNKAVNQLTGARITTVSGGIQKEMDNAVRKIAMEVGKENKNLKVAENLYMDPLAVQEGRITKDDLDQMRFYNQLKRDQKKMLEEQTKKKKAAG